MSWPGSWFKGNTTPFWDPRGDLTYSGDLRRTHLALGSETGRHRPSQGGCEGGRAHLSWTVGRAGWSEAPAEAFSSFHSPPTPHLSQHVGETEAASIQPFPSGPRIAHPILGRPKECSPSLKVSQRKHMCEKAGDCLARGIGHELREQEGGSLL